MSKIKNMSNKIKRQIIDHLPDNTFYKFFSIVFALIFWLFIMDRVNPEIIKTFEHVPVSLENVSQMENDGYVILGQKNFSVNVSIQGRRNNLIKIEKKDIKLSADIFGFSTGIKNIPINYKINDSELSLNELSQNHIQINLDKIVEIPKEVKIKTTGSIATNYVYDSIVLSDDSILVKGPSSYVGQVKYLYGEVDLNYANDVINKNIPLIARDNDGEVVSNVQIDRKYVDVTIPVDKVKKVQIKPAVTGEPKNGYKIVEIISDPETIAIKGNKSIVDSIEEIKTKKIDLRNLDDIFSKKVDLNIDNNYTIPYKDSNAEVTVVIEKINTKEFRYRYSEIPIINLNSEYTTNIDSLEGSVDVTLKDAESLLSKMKHSDFEVFIEGSKINEPGDYELELQVNTNKDYESLEIFPLKIQLVVQKSESNVNADEDIEDIEEDTTTNDQSEE